MGTPWEQAYSRDLSRVVHLTPHGYERFCQRSEPATFDVHRYIQSVHRALVDDDLDVGKARALVDEELSVIHLERDGAIVTCLPVDDPEADR